MITFEEQLKAIKEATKDDPETQALCIAVMEIERDYPDDEETRLSMIDNLIRKSVADGKV